MSRSRRVPLPLAIAYTVFMAVLVPVYWHSYTPSNFFYFCDVALFLTLVCVWTSSPLLAGMCAVGIVVPQMLWVVDFVLQFLGGQITGMTGYMFDRRLSLFLRSLSLFHGWLPFLLLYLVRRLGYDRRSLFAWTLVAWALILFCYFVLPGPGPDLGPGSLPRNVNYVHGFSQSEPQPWMPSWAWLGTMMIGMPLLFFLPAHFFLRWWGRKPAEATPTSPRG